MWDPSQYQLIDFGAGRKLESFSGVLVDRPSPAALETSKCHPELWLEASLRYSLQDGVWQGGSAPDPWSIEHRHVIWDLKPTPYGHLGVFPEQPQHWSWLQDRLRDFRPPDTPTDEEPVQVRVLHLFAYTGGTTAFLAQQGCAVAHVDASQPAVQWARRNMERSGLQSCPIRWIVEDAPLFVSRELRRKRQYDLIVLDPPSFGHGPKGQRWELHRQLIDLLMECALLLSQRSLGILLIGHDDHPAPQDRLMRALEQANRDTWTHSCSYERTELRDSEDRPLDFGYSVRWIPTPIQGDFA